MKLGISSYTCTWAVGMAGHPPPQPLDVMGLLERAHKLGVAVLQICDNLPLDALPAEQVAAMIQQARAWGIDLEVGTRGIDPDHLRRYLALARQCGSPICRVVVDTAASHPPMEEIVATFRALMPEFQEAGVCLAVENHDRFTAREFLGLLESVDHPSLGICLDVANSFGALEGPEVVVKTLAPWAVNLHVKDLVISRLSHNMGFIIEGRPVGSGQLDIPGLVEAVRQAGRPCNTIIELWTPPEGTLEETIRKEAAWGEESVRYMRTLIPD